MIRRATIPALSALLALACACSAPVDEADKSALSRTTPADADQLLDLATLADLVPPSRLEATEATLDQWRFHDLTAQASDSAVGLRAAGRRPRAVVAVDFDSRAVSALEVLVDGLGPGRASLFWAREGENFGPDRVVHLKAGGIEASGELRFDLGGLPSWNGRIGRLRLDLPVPEQAATTLKGIDVVAAADLLAPLTGRSWAIALGRELRSAALVTPSSPLVRDFQLGRAPTSLTVTYALLPGSGCAVALEVAERTEQDRASGPLLSHLIPADLEGSWQQAEFEVTLDNSRASLEITARAQEPCASRRVGIAVAGVRAQTATQDSRPSIVLVSVDTLRPDHLGLHGYERNTSPQLDAWAARHAVVFDDAWANAAWTLPSHASMFTGQTALQHGVNSRFPAPTSLITLAERLRDAGYQTAAWTGGSWLSPKYGLYQGFEEFRWWTTPDGGKDELSTQVKEISHWLEARHGSPLFLFVHTYEVHSPYRPRAPYFASFTDSEPLPPVTDRLLQPLRAGGYLLRKQLEFPGGEPVPEADYPTVAAAYDSGIAYADAQLGLLLAAVERTLGNNVVVLLTSDHGEALGEEGRVSHGHLEDEDLRIPWLLRLPGDRAAGSRIAARVSSVDIPATLLDLAGLPAPEGLDGQSVLSLVEDGSRGAASRPAVESYAASSNLGISLRLRDGGAFIFNDTPWAPRSERERWTGLRSESPELLARLRSEVAQRLTNATGLHLLAWNGASGPLELDLLGPCVHPLTVKLTNPADPELVWVRPQHAKWTVPPGADMRIRFDTPVAPCVSVAVQGTGSEPFRLEIDPRERSASWLAGPVDGHWQILSPGAAPTTGLSAWLKGPVDSSFVDPTGDDAQLMEQLRTLGYLQ